jgi:adenine C2-methylase RlmN of 23S rRNA A2503 and tRNA A37
MPERIALYDLTYGQLSELLTDWGELPFRADQVWSWLYRSLVDDPEQMSNLPARLLTRLATETDLQLLAPLSEQASPSGQTRKVLFGLRDGNTIETVLMNYADRRTVCVSSQVGCAMGCIFCATGQGGLVRNLSAGEIVAQVIHFAREIRAAVNRRYPLADLLSAIRDYVQRSGRRATFEYALVAGVNDAPEQARQLARLLEGLLCHVNLIPLNPTPGCSLQPSPRERVRAFRDRLEKEGIPTTVRMRRGIDIEAGCGQLRQRQPDIAVC